MLGLRACLARNDEEPQTWKARSALPQSEIPSLGMAWRAPWARTGDSQTTATARAVGHNQIGGSLRPPGLQSFNTEVTAMLRALRVEGLMVTEYTEPLPGNACWSTLEGERIL